jgi:exopolyphosphatase/guanosine-5'-triphosphate,3'-diphosphate pyrophosphatase
MPETVRLAAIDIGTVTTRLLVADVGPARISEVERSTDITHLGEDLTRTGRLASEAIARVEAVIARYAERMAELGVERFTALATSASRDAANGAEFREALARAGVEPAIIEGPREAELSFLGATHAIRGESLLVVDLGGGSTELILGDAPATPAIAPIILSARSVDVGSRRITERFLLSDPPTHEELEAARSFVDGELAAYFSTAPREPERMISVAGTATTLAAILAHMEVYDPERIHDSVLTCDDLTGLLEMLAAMPLAERVGVTGLHPGRAPVIVAGALILREVLEMAGVAETTVSEHDLLYGILLDTYRNLG